MAIGPSDVAFRVSQHVGTHTFIRITGLNPFTLSHCGPSPPCVRFAAAVTDYDATLGIRCLTKASGAGIYPRLTKPSFARRTRQSDKDPWNCKARGIVQVTGNMLVIGETGFCVSINRNNL